MSEGSVLHQVLEKVGGTVLVADVKDILGSAGQGLLRIPADETETLGRVLAVSKGYPVMMVPVGIPAILVDKHIVNEIIHIQEDLGYSIRCQRLLTGNHIVGLMRSGLLRKAHQLVPLVERAL